MAQDLYKYFRPEARELLDQFSRGVLDLEKGGDGAATLQRLLRLAHTLKGAARVVKQPEIANRAHAIEDVLSPLRDRADKVEREQIDTVLGHLDVINSKLVTLVPAADADAQAARRADADDAPRTIRADLAETDAVLDGVAETHALVGSLRTVTQSVEQASHLADLLLSQLSPFAAQDHEWRVEARANQRYAMTEELRRKIRSIETNLGAMVDQMDRELRQLREAAERLRLMPAATLFTQLERVARDTARAQSKTVTFKSKSSDIRLDLHVLETIQGALVQIMRNAVAHGIEPEDERVRLGKAPGGSVLVSVFRRDRRIVFACSDDGRGVDLDAVRQAASQRGLAGSVKDSSPDELVRMLLRGGISTSKTVTEVSGRGIGLDVVRASVERLGGEIQCHTVPGSGTTFELIIPPSLASMDALIVERAGTGSTVAIPLDAVRATQRLTASDISFAAPGASIVHEDKAIPFIPLSSALDNTAWAVGRNWAVVLVAGGDGLAAIGV